MISYSVQNIETQVHVFKYPDGCVDIDLQVGSQTPDVNIPNVNVKALFGDKFGINDTLIALALTREALRHMYPYANIQLVIPYLPYARQDRRERDGMSQPLKVIGAMINSMEFATVHVADPHSVVAEACINRLHSLNQYDVFGQVKSSWREWYIVAPDAGATKKCESFAKRVGAAGVITCSKNRVDGKVQGLKVLDYIPQYANLFVLDDLADGAATFKYVHEAIIDKAKYVGDIELAITHGLFTKGVDVVANIYDHVYTTDSYISDKQAENVTVIKLK